MDDFERKRPITDSSGVIFHENEDGKIVVKTGEVNFDDPATTGCIFEDRDGHNQYELSVIDRDVPDYPGQIEAELTATDKEYEQSEKHLVRVPRLIREGAILHWAKLEEKESVKTAAKVAGAVGAAAIGVWTLYKIRNRRSHE